MLLDRLLILVAPDELEFDRQRSGGMHHAAFRVYLIKLQLDWH